MDTAVPVTSNLKRSTSNPLSCVFAHSLLHPKGDVSVNNSPASLNLDGSHRNAPVALIVARSDAIERRWASAPEVAAVLRQAGARVIYYSADGTVNGPLISLIDGLALFAAANIVVCAHGAAEANVLVMRPDATLLEIAPQVMLQVK